MWDEFGLIVGAYILGSFPFMYLLGRVHGVDLRQYPDMHIALWQKVNRLEAFFGTFLDFGKGVAAVLIARALDFSPGWVAFAGVAAVVGQMWPVFMKFKGEKGNSIGLAMSGALATMAMFISLIPIALGFFIRTIPRLMRNDQPMKERLRLGGPPSLSLPLGMAAGFAVMPLAAWGTGQPSAVIIAFVCLFLLLMIRRVTDDLGEDLQQSTGKRSAFLCRLLFDRSEI
ncbi:MAG: glycerol-3-phosphate acyltransferase [Dehalococcoidia bacterium]|nr:glycerol-3-phosphate acyltransferase [Dehalococcoidia bacterium]